MMHRMRGWLRQLGALTRRDQAERDMDEEMRFHLQMEAEKLEREGWDPVTAKREDLGFRLGGEYLLGESLAGRLGLVHSIQNFTVDGAKSEDFNGTYVAAGLGIIPDGGIWQLDLSYGVMVDSDLDTDNSRFSAYLKYLF